MPLSTKRHSTHGDRSASTRGSRHLLPIIRSAARQNPVVTLTGPRQSGKTSLARAAFPRHNYVSLEDAEVRSFANEDPRHFLGQHRSGVVIDDFHRAPYLLTYLQEIVDHTPRHGRFVLIGSEHFMPTPVGQTFREGYATLHLLPYSFTELASLPALDVSALGRRPPHQRPPRKADLMETLFRGFYPQIHDRRADARGWLRDYLQTFVERDLRQRVNVGDLEVFRLFLRMCAGRNGQLLNLSSLASDAGVTHTTVRRWLSALVDSFLVFLLPAHRRSFNRRLIKSPKLYFLDTGLLCNLLRIRSPEELRTHAARGAVFESFVLSELLKARLHRGEEPGIYFWRDSAGHEIDFVIADGERLTPVEARSGQTIAGDFFTGLEFWRKLSGTREAVLVYGGDRSFRRLGATVYRWSDL